LYPDGIPDSVLDKALAPPTEQEIEEQQNSIAGVRFLLWCALKRFNPDMTIEEAADMISIDDLPMIVKAIMPSMAEKKT